LAEQEWCELSTTSMEDGTLDGDKRTNFMYVASRNSSDHLAYQRDLVFLAKLAMKIDEENLVFDLGKCIARDLHFRVESASSSLFNMLSLPRKQRQKFWTITSSPETRRLYG
jgi:hypothetical protein